MNLDMVLLNMYKSAILNYAAYGVYACAALPALGEMYGAGYWLIAQNASRSFSASLGSQDNPYFLFYQPNG